MSFPQLENGVFDGGLFFDDCDYRQSSDIVAYSHSPNQLGIVKHKTGYFVAQFLLKHASPQFSLPVWAEVRTQVICGSVAEAKALTDDFAADNAPSA